MQTKVLQVAKLALAGLLIVAATAIGKAQSIDFGGFNTVKVSGAADVLISKGESCSVKVEGSSEDTSKVKTRIDGGTLYISTKGNIKYSDKLKVKVTIKELNSLDVSGSSNVKNSGELEMDRLNIETSGASEAHLSVKANHIVSETTGASSIHLSGSAKSINSEVSGAGELKAYNLICDSVNVKVSGSGSAKVNAQRLINVDVSGAGSVIYKGEPTDRNVEISGAGSVRQAKGDSETEINESLKIAHGDGDTTKFKWGDHRIWIYGDENGHDSIKKRTKVKSIWTGFEMGVNGYLTYSGSTDMPEAYNFLELDYGKSFCFNFNFWEQNFKLYKNLIAITTGGGFEFNRYFFDNNTTFTPFHDSVVGVVSGNDFNKNCLKSSYITVPLLFEFNTNPIEKKSFHIALGVVGAYNLSTKVKQEYDLDDVKHKSKVKDDFNMEPFKLAATIRAGYGRFNCFATYGLTPFFQPKATAPDLTAFTVGITLIHFD